MLVVKFPVLGSKPVLQGEGKVPRVGVELYSAVSHPSVSC